MIINVDFSGIAQCNKKLLSANAAPDNNKL